ncbi:glycoside hydrolase superfamily [Tirmania nivea]|nr:glycoside hydrolase superfamily [Tirmania nivea]
MRWTKISSFGFVAVSAFSNLASAAWNISANNNVALYWGQNSFSMISNDTAKQQKDLLYYCKQPNVDLIPIGFLNKWGPGVGEHPLVNFANACTGWQMFVGTNLLYCPTISKDIITCQKTYKKKILISLGGGTHGYGGIANGTEAKLFAEKVWAMFGNQWHYFRPFGEAIVDGFDLDLENGPATGYENIAYRLRQLMNDDKAKTGKEWILTGAPQCPQPDAMLDVALKNTAFDAIFVQFYNNPSCQASNWVLGKDQMTNAGFNFAMWDAYAKKSKNPKMKVFLALPLAGEVASGYVSRSKAASIIGDIKRYTNFGGFAGWDASLTDLNNGYVSELKKALNTQPIPALPKVAKRKVDFAIHGHSHHKKHL